MSWKIMRLLYSSHMSNRLWHPPKKRFKSVQLYGTTTYKYQKTVTSSTLGGLKAMLISWLQGEWKVEGVVGVSPVQGQWRSYTDTDLSCATWHWSLTDIKASTLHSMKKPLRMTVGCIVCYLFFQEHTKISLGSKSSELNLTIGEFSLWNICKYGNSCR